MRIAIHRTDGGMSLMFINPRELQGNAPEEIAQREVSKWDAPHNPSELVSWEIIPESEIIPDDREGREEWKKDWSHA